jgi:AraC-like DNA-binding protein
MYLPSAPEPPAPASRGYGVRVARAAKEAASRSTLAPALLRWAAAEGCDAPALAEAAGLPAAALEADETAITPGALGRMLGDVAEALGEPHVALRLPDVLTYRRYDAVALASRAAATPGDVLGLHARYAALVFPGLEARVGTDASGAVRFEAWLRGRPRGLGLAADEYVLALVLARARRGVPLALAEAALVASRPRDLAPIYAAFGTREIAFGAEASALVVRAEDARRALPGADAALVATATDMATAALAAAPRAGLLADAIASKVEAALPSAASVDAIASALHMSARTLQRRLEAEGTTFSEALDRARERRARGLLQDPALGLAEIAYRAGFADLATFSRAFKRWTGTPPGAFRRRGGAAAPRPH